MRKILRSLLFVPLIVLLNFPVSGQQRGGPMGDMFQGRTPPPGAITVLGRSFFGALENGFGNTLALLVGSDDQNVRRELGLTDTEANSVQLVRTQMLLNSPKYAAQFQSMTEEDQQSIQQDISRDIERITAALNNALAPERKEKVQKLVFQSLGGLDSPVVSLSSMEPLNLSEDQKKKVQSVFDEMREERMAQMESMLQMTEMAVAKGGVGNLSPEEREQFRKEMDAFRDQSFATAKKLAERLRQHLTPSQLELERQLIASRPAFLPPLPLQQRREENTAENNDGGPNARSWQPGREMPVQFQAPTEGRFPRIETMNRIQE